MEFGADFLCVKAAVRAQWLLRQCSVFLHVCACVCFKQSTWWSMLTLQPIPCRGGGGQWSKSTPKPKPKQKGPSGKQKRGWIHALTVGLRSIGGPRIHFGRHGALQMQRLKKKKKKKEKCSRCVHSSCRTNHLEIKIKSCKPKRLQEEANTAGDGGEKPRSPDPVFFLFFCFSATRYQLKETHTHTQRSNSITKREKRRVEKVNAKTLLSVHGWERVKQKNIKRL